MNKNDVFTAPIRLCYHRLCHYNSLVDPYKPTIGVGLGLPGFNPGSADRNQVKQAVKNSEADLVEKTMLEDKIRATDWEATNEAIEEQVARESYLQWLRDNERRAASGNSKSATVTSADLKLQAAQAASEVSSSSSPSRAKNLKDEDTKAARSSPKPGCSHSSEPTHISVSFKKIFQLKTFHLTAKIRIEEKLVKTLKINKLLICWEKLKLRKNSSKR